MNLKIVCIALGASIFFNRLPTHRLRRLWACEQVNFSSCSVDYYNTRYTWCDRERLTITNQRHSADHETIEKCAARNLVVGISRLSASVTVTSDYMNCTSCASLYAAKEYSFTPNQSWCQVEADEFESRASRLLVRKYTISLYLWSRTQQLFHSRQHWSMIFPMEFMLGNAE